MLYIIQNTLHEEKLSSTRSILRYATFYKKIYWGIVSFNESAESFTNLPVKQNSMLAVSQMTHRGGESRDLATRLSILKCNITWVDNRV